MLAFWQRRKHRKQLKHIIHSAKTLRSMREDILPPQELADLSAAIATAQAARKGADTDAMDAAGKTLARQIDAIRPPTSWDWLQTNFDVIVVALSVAMCFRALFYQPFKIPTGSMMPTLYGIHSVEIAPADSQWYDAQPFLFFRWCATGQAYHEIRAKASGPLQMMPDSAKPGYVEIRIANQRHFIPVDAAARGAIHARNDGHGGFRAAQGDVLWSGRVISGDFLFVNRWLWNFRPPKRGEVMIFSTNNIKGLPQGTHYIKRMCGIPNETLSIQGDRIYSNAQPITEPAIIDLIANKGKLAPWADNFAGFIPAQQQHPYPGTIAEEGGSVRLGPGQYYALGDNSRSSLDSRFWGPVPERNLLGPAAFVHWPFTSPRWGRIP